MAGLRDGEGSVSDVRVVLITAPSGEVGVGIARDLVERGLAACVNIAQGVRSIYRWEGAIQDDREDLLVVKTAQARVAELICRVREVHPYTVPEIIVLPVVEGSESYLAWVIAETGRERVPSP